MEDLRDILAGSGFSFKKKFGQNFLTDANLLDAIVRDAGADKETAVLEIGAGAGALTRALSAAAKRVLAYEIDPSLQPVLAETLAGCENVEVVFGDFLRADAGRLFRSRAAGTRRPEKILSLLTVRRKHYAFSEQCETVDGKFQKRL